MTRARLESELGPLLARLIATHGTERDRILLEAAMGLSACAAAELWRLDERGWRPLLGLGEQERLPPAERVRAVLDERLAEGVLPPGERVLRAPDAPWALALGAVAIRSGAHPGNDEDSDDRLEALLLVWAALEPRAPDDSEAPPFPTPPTTDPSATPEL